MDWKSLKNINLTIKSGFLDKIIGERIIKYGLKQLDRKESKLGGIEKIKMESVRGSSIKSLKLGCIK